MGFKTYYDSHAAALESVAKDLEAGADPNHLTTILNAMRMAARALRDAGAQLELAKAMMDEYNGVETEK